MSLKNAKTLPVVYFGLHMEPGVAEYREAEINNGDPYRILINEDTCKEMDPTFSGKPVYVRHVDEVNLDKLQEEADGYVVKSFFNQCDGKHWVEFIVVSDRGHEAIRNGWKLSNAYVPKQMTGGGLWHGVEYVKRVTQGEYEHLAIVNNPRYESSIVLTAEGFKKYNNEKELELKRLANSKSKGEDSMFNFFKRNKVENSADLEQMSVTLPRSKREVSLVQVLNEADEHELKKAEPQMANGDHKVKVGEEEMTVNELVAKHLELKDSMKKNEEKKPEDAEKKNEDKKPEEIEKKNEEKKPEDLEKKNGDEKEKELAKNEEEEIAAKKNELTKLEEKRSERLKKFNALKNAPGEASKDQQTVDLPIDKVNRGKARYGSN